MSDEKEFAPASFGLLTAKKACDYTTGTNSSQTLFAANTARKCAVVTNLSLTAVLWVAFGATAVSGKGIPLGVATATVPGGCLVISGQDYVGQVCGITSDTTSHNIAISEV
jgi:hypothetical protein